MVELLFEMEFLLKSLHGTIGVQSQKMGIYQKKSGKLKVKKKSYKGKLFNGYKTFFRRKSTSDCQTLLIPLKRPDQLIRKTSKYHIIDQVQIV